MSVLLSVFLVFQAPTFLNQCQGERYHIYNYNSREKYYSPVGTERLFVDLQQFLLYFPTQVPDQKIMTCCGKVLPTLKKRRFKMQRITLSILILLVALNTTASAQVLFAARTNYLAGNGPTSVSSADFDGDGDNDLAVANEFSNSVSVLFNNGDGTFADSTRVDYSLGFDPTSVFSADIDSDGDNDLAVANEGSDNVSVLLNNGDGTFAPRVDYPAGDGSRSAFSADFDGDGDNDLAVANFNSDNVSVLLNLSTMPAPPPVDTASVSLPNVSTLVGDTVSVAVAVQEDVTGLGIFSAQMNISYDSDLIKAINVALEGTLTQGWVIDDTVVTGIGTSIDTVKIAIATPGPDTLSGSGDIVRIKFAVSDSAAIGDSIPLVFEEFFFNEGDPAANAQDGSVQILELGDISGNGRVTAFDASLVLRSTVGLFVISDTLIADVSGDGTISAFDASLMLRFVVGKITIFPAETGGTPKIVLGERIVSLGDIKTLPDGRFVLPILIDEMDGVLSGQFELSFNPIKLKPLDATTSDLTSDYLFVHNAQDGRLKLSFAAAESVEGSGRIAEIIFDPHSPY